MRFRSNLLTLISIIYMGARVCLAETDVQPVISLTLEQCIDIVTRNSTGVLQSANQNDLNGVQVLESYGQFLPNLLASGGYGYSTGTTLYSFEGRTLVNSSGQNASLGLSTTLNLFNGFSDYAGLKSALALKSSSEYSLEWAKEQVALDLTQTYLQLVLDQQILDIAQKNLAASQSRLKLLQGQSEVGAAAVSDLYRQQAETSADEFAMTNDQSRVQIDQVLLVRKLRVDPSKNYRFETPPLAPSLSALAEKGVDQLVKESLDKRPDVQSNTALADSTDWNVTRARSGYLPKLDLVFSRDAAGSLLSKDLVNGVDYLSPNQPGLPAQIGNQVQYSIGLSLSWSIFDRFVTRYNVAQADTAFKNTQINLDDSRLQVQSDIRTAYTNYQSVKLQLNSVRMGLESAQKSYDAVEGMYEVGSSSIVDVLTAQAALVQARSNQAQALTNLKLQEKTLEYATGSLVHQGDVSRR
jgi:outer membrane protein